MKQRRRLPAQRVVVCEEGGVHLAQSRADARQGAVVRAALVRVEVTVRARARARGRVRVRVEVMVTV